MKFGPEDLFGKASLVMVTIHLDDSGFTTLTVPEEGASLEINERDNTVIFKNWGDARRFAIDRNACLTGVVKELAYQDFGSETKWLVEYNSLKPGYGIYCCFNARYQDYKRMYCVIYYAKKSEESPESPAS